MYVYTRTYSPSLSISRCKANDATGSAAAQHYHGAARRGQGRAGHACGPAAVTCAAVACECVLCI